MYICERVSVFSPSLTRSYSTHTYILDNNEKQEKKQAIFLYTSVVLLSYIQHRHIKKQAIKIYGPVHIPCQQYLIN